MTVIENLMVASGRTDSRPTRRNQLDRNRKILEETGLAEVEETKAGDLTLIRLKRLELARALALEPQVLLLDEIGAGLIESELEELIALIAKLRERIDCIVIIEHVMDVVVRSCDRLVVLNWGKKLTEGLPTEVLRNDDVMRIYLGASAVEASNSDVTGAIDNTGSKTTAGQSDSIVATPQPDGTVSEKTTTPDSATTVLHVQDLVAGYGASLVVRKVTFSLYEGEVVALLGANGAGKSTISKACTGMLPIRSGQVTLGTQRIDGLSSNNVARNGLAHCMEGRRIFSDLSVEENLTIGATAVGRTGKQVRESLERVYELFPALRGKATQSGGSLSGGQQGMLAIGRSLMADPKVVIFDEISLGLAPVVINEIYDALSILRSQGLTMLLVEQDIDRAMAISDRVLLLEKGRIVLAGSPSELAENPQLRSLYLGVA
jgi:branched-chain amino acid transport system ATP-binding protein